MRRLSLARAALATAAGLLTLAAQAGERTLIDDTGREVQTPERPARVVVLHEALLGVPLADLGLDPVASYGRADDGSTLMATDFYAEVLGDRAPSPAPAGIGPFGEIDLERVRALAPDLILGLTLHADKVARLSTVAPVYLQAATANEARGFEAEAQIAKVIGREAAFEALHAPYAARIAALRPTVPDAQDDPTYLAVVLSDRINAVGEMSGMVQALEDLGYRRLDGAGGEAAAGSTLLAPLSAETFGRLDPTLLVVMTTFAGDARDPTATREALDRIVPGWTRFLKPAREGRILFLDSGQAVTPTVTSAQHTLDAWEAWRDGL